VASFDKQRAKGHGLVQTAVKKLDPRRIGILVSARVDALEGLRGKMGTHSFRARIGTHIWVVANVVSTGRYSGQHSPEKVE
jgi:hypothetical protein